MRRTSQSYRTIRCWFLATFSRDILGEKDDIIYQTIKHGNEKAHHGNAVVDASLCQDDFVQGRVLFPKLYGFTWEQVLEIGKSMPWLYVNL